MKNKIYIIGNFSFPRGNASGSRVLSNGYLLRELGYEVEFIGLDNKLNSNSNILDTKQVYDGFIYYNLPYPIGMKGWIDYKKRFEEVISVISQDKVHAVISYGSPTVSIFNKLLLDWCKKNDILNIADVVDWLGATSGSLLHRIVKFLDTNYQKRYLNSKADGVITISKYLENYYKSKNCKTVVIPPLVNLKRYNHLEKIIAEPNNDTKVKLVYVGVPFPLDGRNVKKDSYKDRLDKVIDALYKVQNKDFVFDIYGLKEKEYLSVVKEHKEILHSLKEKVIFRGAIDNEKAIEKIAMADFSILFRDVNKMTSSGFPTKFVETISCGTPIITTKTSDLVDYLEEGVNGFFVEMNDEKKLTESLNEILEMSKQHIALMKKKTFESKIFGYSNFTPRVQNFLEKI